VFAGLHVALVDLRSELSLLLGSEEGDLVDLLEVGLQAAF